MPDIINDHFPQLPATVKRAAGVQQIVCVHGTIFIQLFDEHDTPFAIATADARAFHAELTKLIKNVGLEEDIGPVQGNA